MSVDTGLRPVNRRELIAFADVVGAHGPVACAGGRTHWFLGGSADANARVVRAPVGVVRHEPDEMIVRVGAGTSVAELDAVLAATGQCCPLDPVDPARSTVGGLLATGSSGVRRLRYGPVRDLLLEARYVTATGEVAVAGAPVVKNVTGFDLPRLLVGSFGTLGFFGDVVLRCRPRPGVSQWFLSGDCDPFGLRLRLFAPSSILWDGKDTWVLLEGSAGEIAEERARAGITLHEVASPPQLPAAARLSIAPHELRASLMDRTPGSFVAEVGVGAVHASWLGEPRVPGAAALHDAVKRAYDPTGRLNPGRHPW